MINNKCLAGVIILGTFAAACIVWPEPETYQESLESCLNNYEWQCTSDSECEFEEMLINKQCKRIARLNND